MRRRPWMLWGLILSVGLGVGPGVAGGTEKDRAEIVRLGRVVKGLDDLIRMNEALAEKCTSLGRLDDARATRQTIRRLKAERNGHATRIAELRRKLGQAADVEASARKLGPIGGALAGRAGPRDLERWGGDAAMEDAVARGLEWLAKHQHADGRWDCDGFTENCRLNGCGGPGDAIYDVGVTGLATLAFLGAGHTHATGPYRGNVKRALTWLKGTQDLDGCFGPRITNKFTYYHACAALAMVEAYAQTGSPPYRASAQRAIDFIAKAQNPYLAWRYGIRPQDNDTSVTTWMVMALRSAKVAGLDVPKACFDGPRAWLEKVTEPEYGRVGYTARGTGPCRTEDTVDKWPSGKSESLTACGVLCRIVLGEEPRKSEMIRKGVELCLKALPEWDEVSGEIDMYYWYHGTLALFQVGGEPWKAWSASLKTAVADHQRRDGDQKGSWDPVGPWGREGGRVYATALMAMTLEVNYRYERIHAPLGRLGFRRSVRHLQLDRPVTFAYRETPLVEAFDGIARSSKVEVLIDEACRQALAGKTVTLAVEAMRLRGALALLAGMGEVDWTYEEGRVHVRAR